MENLTLINDADTPSSVGVYTTPHAVHPHPTALYRAQRGRCFYCRLPMSPRPNMHDRDGKTVLKRRNKDRKRAGLKKRIGGWTLDHVFPRQLAYSTTNNVVLACGDCNSRKGSSMPFADEIGCAILLYASVGAAFAPRRARSNKHFEYSCRVAPTLPLSAPQNKQPRSPSNVRVPIDRPIP